MMKTTVTIQNLKCAGCASTIEKKLKSLKGVTDIQINIDESTVAFIHASEETYETVHKALLKLGYPIEGDDNTLGSKAKSYVSCAIGKMSS